MMTAGRILMITRRAQYFSWPFFASSPFFEFFMPIKYSQSDEIFWMRKHLNWKGNRQVSLSNAKSTTFMISWVKKCRSRSRKRNLLIRLDDDDDVDECFDFY
jgi:hypothetical protein